MIIIGFISTAIKTMNTGGLMKNFAMEKFIEKLKFSPENILFEDTITIIDQYYFFEPTMFKNGDVINKINENNGSCKLLAFANLNQFSVQETLDCFGQYYRDDVSKNPDGNNHQNIRNFMRSGWDAVSFGHQPLK